jgi:hypothetical protein
MTLDDKLLFILEGMSPEARDVLQRCLEIIQASRLPALRLESTPHDPGEPRPFFDAWLKAESSSKDFARLEEVCGAFVAKYHIDPKDCVIVQQQLALTVAGGGGWQSYIRGMTPAEKQERDAPKRLAPSSGLVEAAQAMVEKLLRINASAETRAVYQIAQDARGKPYTGPQYDVELRALVDALEAEVADADAVR